MSEHLRRLLELVPTRRAALILFAVALGVFWFQALGWPMAKGRDTWDYLVYYLQFFDSKPPLSQVQLFRTSTTCIGTSEMLVMVNVCVHRVPCGTSPKL